MGLFGSKKRSIDDRADSLNREIASLEAQIDQLRTALSGPRRAEPGDGSRRARTAARETPTGDLRLEPVNHESLHEHAGAAAARQEASRQPRNIQREVTPSFWARLVRFFKGPSSSNPKLVSYLAAGNIQGLQALRYEKRVHRNRTLLWVGIILVALIGLLKMLIR